MDVTLICPPWYTGTREPVLANNLGLAYIAAVLRQGGHTVRIIDALAEGYRRVARVTAGSKPMYRMGLGYDEIVRRIPSDTDWIGLNAPFTSHARITRELAAAIKRAYPEKPLVLGGAYPSTLPEKALQEPVDYVVCGEGEAPMLKLLSGASPSAVPGVCFQSDGEKVMNLPPVFPDDLDSMPLPARDLLALERYYYQLTFGRRTRRRTLAMLSSRGCPYNCTFCATHPVCGYKWRARSVDSVIDEIRLLVKEHRVQHINFIDDNLSFDRKRTEELCDRLIELGLDLTWCAESGLRVDSLDRSLLRKFKRSGCTIVTLAIESGDPEILRRMNKRLDLDRVEEVAHLCREEGIDTRAFLIVGYPGETRESFEKSLAYCKMLKRLGVAGFSISAAQTYPRTALSEYCREQGYLVDEALNEYVYAGLGTDLNIQTEDFDTVEVGRRRSRAKRELDGIRYWTEKLGAGRAVKRLVPKERIDLARRKLSGLNNKLVVTAPSNSGCAKGASGVGAARETRLLRLCSRPHPDAAAIATIRDVAGAGVAWNLVLREAQRNKVEALVYKNVLSAQVAEAVPPRVLKALRERYEQNAARGSTLLAEVASIIRTLNDDGIETVVLKGAAVAESLYEDIGLRPMLDADIMVHREDMARVKNVMADAGFELPPHDYPEGWYVDCFRELVFFKERPELNCKLCVEIAWDPFHAYSSFRIDVDEMWRETQPITVDGVQALGLSIEMELLLFAAHLHSHRYVGLLRYCDIYALLQRSGDQLDWDGLVKKARQLRVTVPLYYALRYAAEYLDAGVPKVILARLRPRFVTARIFERLPRESWSFMDAGVPWQRIGIDLLLIERVPDKIRYCAGLARAGLSFLLKTRGLSHSYQRENAVLERSTPRRRC